MVLPGGVVAPAVAREVLGTDLSPLWGLAGDAVLTVTGKRQLQGTRIVRGGLWSLLFDGIPCSPLFFEHPGCAGAQPGVVWS